MDDASTGAWTLFFMQYSELDEKSAMALRHELWKRDNIVNILSFPSRLRGFIGPYSELFVKQLTVTDTKSDQGRLSIKKEFAVASLLPLLNKDENPVDGVQVTVYDPNGMECQMMFKFWAQKYYVLTQGWKAFCHDRHLSSKDVVKLRMFRHLKTRSLCFVISSVKTTK